MLYYNVVLRNDKKMKTKYTRYDSYYIYIGRDSKVKNNVTYQNLLA